MSEGNNTNKAENERDGGKRRKRRDCPNEIAEAARGRLRGREMKRERRGEKGREGEKGRRRERERDSVGEGSSGDEAFAVFLLPLFLPRGLFLPLSLSRLCRTGKRGPSCASVSAGREGSRQGKPRLGEEAREQRDRTAREQSANPLQCR